MPSGYARRRRAKEISWHQTIDTYNPSVVGDLDLDLDLASLEGADDWRARGLVTKIRSLHEQLKTLQSERDTLQLAFEAECGEALRLAVESLQHLVEGVARADKSILFWHTAGGTPLRLALKVLKPIGMDRDAGTIMARKGVAIRSQADHVSEIFERCGSLCQASLVDVQDLHLRTNNFVQTDIGGAQNDAQDLAQSYERAKQNLQLDINKKELDVATVQIEATRTSDMVANLEEQHDKATRAANSSRALGAAGIGGGLLLGAMCVFFPPAGAVAAGIGAFTAGAVGVSSTVVSGEHSAEARRLQSEQSSYEIQLSGLQVEIRGLQREVRTLESSKVGYDEAVRSIGVLEARCENLRSQTNQFLHELNGARVVLARGVAKTAGIAAALNRCEYARTRRDFVSRVEGILDDLRSGNRITAPQPKLLVVSDRLEVLGKKTDRVMAIMTRSFSSS
ncbi:hypothetical protein B0T26DRAFT_868774 [Lasiosphaeria miniovina]|uniref:Uncharacterized protein n=1 Tax=Lasiosphaeria miniovina TaxID=1954250 RepID=A0AA40B4N8_9PEZI|nr:uncharacterized protein B0T26DRAFT_868774 [Lasiosphaeria miniovina]KAK0727487.1 hypothetical protein B0T26DRAFT_868774 [Lasiosphaeria miniovina]